MKKTVLYISEYPIYERDGRPTSDYASIRYRLIIPAQELSKRGHAIQVLPPPPPTFELSDAQDSNIDAVVFGKTYVPQNEKLATQLSQKGVRVVLDICDDLFDDHKYGSHQHRMCAIADTIIASSEAMADVIFAKTGKRARVISDPIEGHRNTPLFAVHKTSLNLLWFGHPSNFESLQLSLVDLMTVVTPTKLKLTVVTKPTDRVQHFIQTHNIDNQKVLPIEFIPWSTSATWNALYDCDIVVIPSINRPDKLIKSPNRLIESIWAGRCVVAHPLPSYQAFQEYCWLGDSLSAGIMHALNDRDMVINKIASGQQYIGRTHSPEHIASCWESALFHQGSSSPAKRS